MELVHYLRALSRLWSVVAVCVVTGLIGVFCYLLWFGQSTANATVAVLEPAVVRASSGQQAQISFNSVAESYTVAERVITRLGLPMTAEGLRGRVSVKLSRSLVMNVATPLYQVQVNDPNPELAIRIADTVVDEARRLFVELNALDPGQVDAAFRLEEQRLTGELRQLQRNLLDFEDVNDVRSLPVQIDEQRRLLATLRQSAQLSSVETTAATATRDELNRQYQATQAEVNRLRSLQGEYDRLGFEQAVAGAIYQQLSGRVSDLPPISNVVGSYQSQLVDRAAAARKQLDQARARLADYQRVNGTGDLLSEIAIQTQIVNDLRRAVAADTTAGAAARQERQGRLDAEQVKLTRLRRLQPEHDRLAFEVSVAGSVFSQLTSQASQPVVSQDIANEKAQFEGRLNAAHERLERAQAALASFRQEHRLADLTTELATQVGLANDLYRQLGVLRPAEGAFDPVLTREQAQLERLMTLAPRHDELATRIAQLQAQINHLQLRKLDIVIEGTLAPSSQVKPLDSARIQPNVFWSLVLYLLGALLGGFAGLIAVYLNAYFDHTPRSEQEVQQLIGAPVLARIRST